MSRYSVFDVELGGVLDIAKQLSDMPPRILQAQRRALVTMQRRLGTEAKRDIGAEYNLTASRISDGLSVRNTEDGVRLVGRSRGVNAIEFGAQWSRVTGSGLVATSSRRRFTAIRYNGKLRGDSALGARFAIKRGKAPAVHAGSFIARGKNGALLVLERKGKARLPLQAVYGPSVGQMLKHGRRPERLAEFAQRVLLSDLQRQLGTR